MKYEGRRCVAWIVCKRCGWKASKPRWTWKGAFRLASRHRDVCEARP